MVDYFVKAELSHGKVKIWSLSDDCPKTGKDTRKAKKLMSNMGISYDETIVPDHQASQYV